MIRDEDTFGLTWVHNVAYLNFFAESLNFMKYFKSIHSTNVERKLAELPLTKPIREF